VNGAAPVPPPINSNQCLISVGGVIQRPDDSGSEGFRLSGGNIIFSSAPSTGEDFFGVILAGADYVNVGANFPDGTFGAPSITFDQDNDTGYYRSGSGAVSFSSNGTASGTWSSAGISAPALSPTSSTVPSNGVYLPATNSVAISTNGTGRLFVDASGNVGVGTSSPATLLHISGSDTSAITRIASTSNAATAFNGSGAGLELICGNANLTNKFAPAIKFGSTDVDFTTTRPKFGAAITAEASQVYSADTSGGMNLAFWTAPNDPGTGSGLLQRMVIANTGNVGIGTQTPGSLLDLAASNDGATGTTANNTLRFTDTDTTTVANQPIGKIEWYSADTSSPGARAVSYIMSSAAGTFSGGDIRFGVSANGGTVSEAARIDSSGRLGIGTTSPNAPLSFGTATGTAGTANKIRIYDSAPNIYGFGVSANQLDYISDGSHVFYGSDNGGSPLEKARLTSDGKLLVGTSSSTGLNSNTAPVIAGNFASFTGSVSATTGTATTLFALENLNASYIVTAIIAGTVDAANYSAVYMVASVSSASCVIQAIRAGGLLTLSLSGANVQVTQSSGVNQTVSWSVTRMANL
jgi:hypothetical protein